MENKNMIITAAMVYSIYDNGSGNNDSEQTEANYLYLDRFSDEIDDWYSGQSSDIMTVLENQMNETGIDASVGDHRMVEFEGYESSSGMDEEGNYIGIDIGIFLYTSMDYDSYYSGYFTFGPVLEDVTSNVVYVYYSDYKMNEDYETEYDLNLGSTTGRPLV